MNDRILPPAAPARPGEIAPELAGRAWLGTGGRALKLGDLRGRMVLLDFWTFCCVNCLHVLDELRTLERSFADVLVVIGVHSPKFSHEANPAALAANVRRYQVEHPVLDDPELATWRAYGARAWPTLVLIDPDGRIVAHMAGEGHGEALAQRLAHLADLHRSRGSLVPGPGPYRPPESDCTALSFPSKAVALASGSLLVSDAGHHRLAEVTLDGELTRVIGTGERGWRDGSAGQACFSEPNGLCRLPSRLAARLGCDVVVADSANHALRGVNLATGAVTTLAGTGSQSARRGRLGPVLLGQGGGRADQTELSSPWDVVWDPARRLVLIAMAGVHQIWAYDPAQMRVGVLAGNSGEGLIDGPALLAELAQPSGLAMAANGRCWFADSETSALRWLDQELEVGTAIGSGLFDFGLADGAPGSALMQHPLGLAVPPNGQVVVADTFNGAVRIFDPNQQRLRTLATGLAEPSDVVLHPALANDEVVVVESSAHRLIRVKTSVSVNPAQPAKPTKLAQPASQAEPTSLAQPASLARPTSLAQPAGPAKSISLAQPAGPAKSARPHLEKATGRPAMDLPAGQGLDLEIDFTVPAGRRLDDASGPAIEVSVSASPPELLIQGGGPGHQLRRRLELAPGHGVLHVTARVATCDAAGAATPACHLNAQDWGIPVVVHQHPDQNHQHPDQVPSRISLPLG
ncbi:MAG: redoxin domain-containing protein [Micrococcales bacterium]|nr:redoxin domain-containing protein [Micrococcales bacterium]